MVIERRGGDFYESRHVRMRYLRHRHSGTHSPNVVMEEPAFLEAVGPVTGCRILDLGCGDGSTATALLDAGAASYVGIDGSAGMIEEARRRVQADAASFVCCDLEELDLVRLGGAGTFDVVVSRMALHYVADLDPVFERVTRLLVPGGRLVLSVVHPVITSHDSAGDGPRTTWTVDRYFERGPRVRAWFGSTVTWQHRTVEDWVGLVVRHGLRLDVLSECEPSAELLADAPDELARRRRVPLMLLIAGRAS